MFDVDLKKKKRKIKDLIIFMLIILGVAVFIELVVVRSGAWVINIFSGSKCGIEQQ